MTDDNLYFFDDALPHDPGPICYKCGRDISETEDAAHAHTCEACYVVDTLSLYQELPVIGKPAGIMTRIVRRVLEGRP